MEVIANPVEMLEEIDWIEKFNEACVKMDVSSIEELLDDDVKVNNQSKWEFLSYVRDRFNCFRKNGAIELHLHRTKCAGCSFGCPVLLFNSSESKGNWIAFSWHSHMNTSTVGVCNLPKM